MAPTDLLECILGVSACTRSIIQPDSLVAPLLAALVPPLVMTIGEEPTGTATVQVCAGLPARWLAYCWTQLFDLFASLSRKPFG